MNPAIAREGCSEPSVPTMEEAIEATPADKLFAVDVKTPWSIFELARVVKRRRMEARTLVWCSSAMVVRYAVWRMPGVEVVYYKDFEDGPNNIEFVGKAARLGAKAVSLDWRGISPEVVSAAHWLGLKVYSWHKEHEITQEKLESGLDGLITDYPSRSRGIIEGL
jgi:glycerophosphoryl diester phosphodiesterase